MTKPGDNTIEARVAPFVDRVENLMEMLESERGKYMAACKVIRTDLKELYGEVKGADINVKAVKQIVKYRELERKQEALADEMEGEDGAYDYEMLVASLGQLGDLPLGQAALDLAGGGDGDDDDRDLRPPFLATPDDEPAPKRGRKPKLAETAAGSPEEREALAEIEASGISGAASGATAH